MSGTSTKRTVPDGTTLRSDATDAIGTSEELLKNNAIYREVYLSQNKQETETVGKEAS